MIAVIIATHDLERRGFDRLRWSLFSLQDQPVKIYVVDSSKNGTGISALADRHKATYLHTNTGGVFNICRNLNTGMKAAVAGGAEYLHCTGADFVYSPDYFQKLLPELSPARFFLSPVYMAANYALWTKEKIRDWTGWPLRDEWGGQAPGLQTFHKSWWETSGGYDENLSGWGGMDEDMIYRAKRFFGKIEFVPFREVYHVYHEPFKTVGRRNEEQQKRNWAYRDKWKKKGPLNWRERK